MTRKNFIPTETVMSEETIENKIGAKVNQSPRVSVIIPAYKTADFISETLDSVLVQTCQDYEIILVNDGSPDTEELEKVLEKYSDKICYLKQKNSGTASARNTGIKHSQGEFLAFLDSDDIWFPEYLEIQIKELAAKEYDLIYCDAEYFGYMRGSCKTFMQECPSHGPVTAESLIGATCNVITSGTLVKKEKVVKAEMFDETLPRIGMEDFDLWFRLVKSGAKLCYQKKVLLKYRVRPDSLSGSNIKRAEREITALDTVAQKHNLNDSENTAFKEQRRRAVAELEIEKGKDNLVRGNYEAARENILVANRYYRRLKLSVLTSLLKIQPHIAQKLYRILTPEDFSFVSHNGKDKKG